jgi:L-fuconolactonase
MKKIIDTHIHAWNLERAEYPWLQGDDSILNRTWRIEEIEDDRKDAGIVSGVLVQASSNLEDTNLMLDIAYATDWISGVVGWLPLTNAKATRQLLEERFLKERYFKGVRHQIHNEKDHAWLLRPDVIESLKLLADHSIPYDVVGILPDHIETVLKVIEKVPGIRMVFDHLNWPPIPAGEKFGRWGELMSEAAQHSNLYAKISGLGTASGNFKGRTEDNIKPYVEFALQHFGSDRCFCGGDWPVSMLADNYFQTWHTTKNIIRDLLPEAEQESVFYSNAIQFYNLQLV